MIAMIPVTAFDISIHAPREGGDLSIYDGDRRQLISIHAPREGGDISQAVSFRHRRHFNPRPPRGGRPEGGQQRDKD